MIDTDIQDYGRPIAVGRMDFENMTHEIVWLTADLPIPEEKTVEAKIQHDSKPACPLNNASCRGAVCYQFDECEVREAIDRA